MKRFALLALLALFSGTAAPQGAPGARVCSPANGQKATVAEVAADPKAWLGKCITVQGIYSAERVYADADAIYGVNSNSIGGYVDGRGSMDGFWKGEFAGRVTDCAAAQADLDTGLLRSPGISLDDRVLGCRKPEGPFLVFMSPRGLEPADVLRRLPGAKGGDLVPAPKDWSETAVLEERADKLLAAFKARDRALLATMLPGAYAVGELLASTDTPLLSIAPGAQRQVFVVGRVPGAGDQRFAAVTCYCRTKDCSKTWPIALRDADNQPDRPYACIRNEGARASGVSGKMVWSHTAAGVSRTGEGLPER